MACIRNVPHSAYTGAAKRGQLTGVGVAIGLHAGMVFLLMQLQPVRTALSAAAPILVTLVSPPTRIEKPQEAPQPRPVKLRVERPKSPQPLLIASASDAPASFVAAPLPPMPVSMPEEPVVSAPAAPPIVAVAPPQPVVPPGFNADYLNNPAPTYPPLSRRMGEEGKVMLRVLVNVQGLPVHVELKSSSGYARLDSVALETVRQWRFVPARRGDEAVNAWVLVPISFSLRS